MRVLGWLLFLKVVEAIPSSSPPNPRSSLRGNPGDLGFYPVPLPTPKFKPLLNLGCPGAQLSQQESQPSVSFLNLKISCFHQSASPLKPCLITAPLCVSSRGNRARSSKGPPSVLARPGRASRAKWMNPARPTSQAIV